MIFEVITEPVIADRLYGGIMERIAEEVAKMENEKLDEEGWDVIISGSILTILYFKAWLKRSLLNTSQ